MTDPIGEIVTTARKALEQSIGLMPGDQPTALPDLKGRILATRDLTRTLNQLVRDLADTVKFMMERDSPGAIDPLLQNWEHLTHSQGAIWMGRDYLARSLEHSLSDIPIPEWYEYPARRRGAFPAAEE